MFEDGEYPIGWTVCHIDDQEYYINIKDNPDGSRSISAIDASSDESMRSFGLYITLRSQVKLADVEVMIKDALNQIPLMLMENIL